MSNKSIIFNKITSKLKQLSGKNVNFVYIPQERNVTNDLIKKMNQENIPFFYVNGTLLINGEKDAQKVKDLNMSLLDERINYNQEQPQNDLKSAISSLNKNTNKTFCMLKNVKADRLESIKKKSNGIFPGFTIGTQIDSDGNYDITVHTPSLLFNKPTNFYKAYLEATLEGDSNNQTSRELNNHRDDMMQVDQFVCENPISLEPYYIVSDDNPSSYIAVRADGFTKHNWLIENGDFRDVETEHCSVYDKGYGPALTEALMTMHDKRILQSPDELSAFLYRRERLPKRGGKRAIPKLRAFHKINKQLSSKINDMILQQSGSKQMPFTDYTMEAAEIMNAATKGDYTKYNAADIKEIQDIITKNGFSLDDYSNIGRVLVDNNRNIIENVPVNALKEPVYELAPQEEIEETERTDGDTDRAGKD